MLGDILERLIQTLQGLFVTIPVDNTLGAFYVIVNTIFQLLAGLVFGGSDGGDFLPF